MNSKSTSSFNVSRSGDESYSESAPGVPGGLNIVGGTRGEKNPGTPKAALALALHRLNASCRKSKGAGTASGMPDDTRFQNSRNRGMRFSGRFPAISAALIAPIDTPVIQFGAMPASCMPSYTPAWYAPSAPPPCSARTVLSCEGRRGLEGFGIFDGMALALRHARRGRRSQIEQQ